MLDLIIKNGEVVLSNGHKRVEIGIKDGKISIIAEKITEESKEVIDAAGQYVLPGMVDTHVHISEPGRTEWEGFETGSKALAAGGTTSYVEMPLNALPATTNKKALDLKLEAAGKGFRIKETNTQSLKLLSHRLHYLFGMDSTLYFSNDHVSDITGVLLSKRRINFQIRLSTVT